MVIVDNKNLVINSIFVEQIESDIKIIVIRLNYDMN